MQNHITNLLIQSLADNKLDTDEKHDLYQLLITLEPEDRSYLRNQAFNLVRDHMHQAGDVIRLMKWLEKVVRLVDKSYNTNPVDFTAHFSPGDDCRNAIIALLNAARIRVDICVFTISDNRITEAIKSVHQRKVDVRILTDNDKANDRGSDVYTLQQQGIPVCMDASPKHMHHKFALIDQQLVNGSFNWTRSASDYNQENIVISNHAGLVKAFSGAFDELWVKLGQAD